MQYTQQRCQQQQRRAIQQCSHVPYRSVAASDDTWRIEMKCVLLLLFSLGGPEYRPYDHAMLVQGAKMRTHILRQLGARFAEQQDLPVGLCSIYSRGETERLALSQLILYNIV